MPTPVFLTGFEHGKVVTGATPAPNDRIWHAVVTTGGTPGIDTTTPKNGARCLDIPTGTGAASYVSRNTASVTIVVMSFYIRFVGSLPSADCMLVAPSTAAGTFPSLWFNASDSKLYARVTANGATGFTVAADTWYLVDVKFDISTGTRTCDVTVNGTALGQASAIIAASTTTSWRLGRNVATTTATGNIRYDDLIVSVTSADYPMGEHEVLKMSPNADGTHSFTANDFIRGDAGAAILTSDTDVHTLVDDVPFGAIGTTDSVQQNVIRTTGYVELALEAAPRTVDAWGIHILGQYDADATGACTCTLKENDGGTLRDVYTNADVSNTTETFLSHTKATAPTGGAYTQAKLDALRLRWGFSGDVTGSPIVHALMVEAAYPIAAGPTIVEADGAAAGAATVTSVAVAIWNGITAAAGLAASAVAGAALLLTVVSAAGVATGAATSAIVQEGSGASAGSATASSVGVRIAATQGASAGVAVAAAEGADGASGGQGIASGVATASGVSSATAGVAAISAGVATGSAASATIRSTGAAAAGLATVQSNSEDANAGSNALASGIAQASAVSGATVGSSAHASGFATVLAVTDAPAAVESGSSGRMRSRPRRLSHLAVHIALLPPTVLVRGWTQAPAHAGVRIAWPSPLITSRGRSVPAFRVGIRSVLDVRVGLRIEAVTEPPTFDLSDEAFLLLADQLLNG